MNSAFFIGHKMAQAFWKIECYPNANQWVSLLRDKDCCYLATGKPNHHCEKAS